VNRRWIVLAVVLAGTVGLAWSALAVLGDDGSIVDSPLVGRPVPAVELEDLGSGDLVRLAAPGQVVVINFWAPWCVPCKAEHELFNRLAPEWIDDVRIVGVAYQSDPAEVVTFLDRVGRAVPALIDADGRASIEFGVAGVPETFFVDRSGVVRARVSGAVSETQLRAIVERLRAGESLDGL
jgi:cytochrome c biogenesis protein CcmG/thiol:disulfide interchange protein DsbE